MVTILYLFRISLVLFVYTLVISQLQTYNDIKTLNIFVLIIAISMVLLSFGHITILAIKQFKAKEALR